MKVAELLDRRRENWHELEGLCADMEKRRSRRMGLERVARFSRLYRSACADLALAEAYQLPPNTVRYLHHLVGRAHNQLYRGGHASMGTWLREMFLVVPGRLFRDRYLRMAAVVFWGTFLATMFLAYASASYSDGFAERLLGRENLAQMEQMHSESIGSRNFGEGSAAAGFYIRNNTSIGLQCFAFGLILGVGGLIVTTSNAVILGTVFGHMLASPQRDNFVEFVTAHGPFELTAIVVASAAGMRMGFSVIDTHGLTRGASLRRASRDALPTVWVSIAMFVLAAMIEGFLSPSTAPYWVKIIVAVVSCALLFVYFVVLGFRQRELNAA